MCSKAAEAVCAVVEQRGKSYAWVVRAMTGRGLA